ncbi:hypothetical protein KUTeg_022981 [Tegillarca granosa]|uniref:Isopenicillin N synthase-like Fe(2+) 2OG dioxygenase domain-containing protein n=1 Tax=Tegillarca granosa TaxID=220873 RepID=A0ABQ9E3E1_TEGGR|nr:hypothetical protein KUTeg_022981 [Tegillarca granosa]
MLQNSKSDLKPGQLRCGEHSDYGTVTFLFQTDDGLEKHKVGMPTGSQKKQGRQSIAFFINPDDETIVKCLDGSGKYEPISSIDYLNMRLGETY